MVLDTNVISEPLRAAPDAVCGLRVIYYHLTEDRQIWMFTVHEKDEAADLTAEEKRGL